MTYCAGVLVRDGLVMVADTRTNAGLDNISTFRKLHLVSDGPERTLAICAAGNLSITQSTLSLLQEGVVNPETDEVETLHSVPTMFRAAQLIGRALRKVYAIDGPALEEARINTDVTFLFGGQIGGSAMRLFMIYAAGNFIECGGDAPFLQIGEHKYGKPILDRAVTYETHIYDVLKIALISMDSTIRSNLAVGLPIDIMVLRRDALKPELIHRIDAGERYFHDLRERWSAALKAAHMAIPRPPYQQEPGR
jgi:putative proteasome-type protease